jgi:hypothetical protein
MNVERGRPSGFFAIHHASATCLIEEEAER